MDEEERFLQSRQEREERRNNRAKEVSEEAQQRERFEAEMAAREAEITGLLRENNKEAAQCVLNGLRALVQDTCTTVKLTAHEMAKSNATVVRLQQDIDQSGSRGREAEGSSGVKKFKFSSKAKAGVINQTPSVSSTAASSSTAEERSHADVTPSGAPQPPAHGDSYGPHAGSEPLFIRPSKAIFVTACTDCTVLVCPIAGSAFFFGCRNCRIYVACHQLRMKDCDNVEVYVWCASTPIIESCDAMRFGPYTAWKGLLASPLPSTGVKASSCAQWVSEVGEIQVSDETENNYKNVDDFQWLRKTQSPHWRVLAPEEQQACLTVFAPAHA